MTVCSYFCDVLWRCMWSTMSHQSDCCYYIALCWSANEVSDSNSTFPKVRQGDLTVGCLEFTRLILPTENIGRFVSIVQLKSVFHFIAWIMCIYFFPYNLIYQAPLNRLHVSHKIAGCWTILAGLVRGMNKNSRIILHTKHWESVLLLYVLKSFGSWEQECEFSPKEVKKKACS